LPVGYGNYPGGNGGNADDVMRNIRLTVAYDGTNYFGFQEQKGTGLATIQEKLEQGISFLAGHRIKVIGAGRTDAGVHARGQVVNFDAGGWNIPTERIPKALNGVLPADIAVVGCADAAEDFHSRFSAVEKEYRYTIHNARMPDPFRRRYSYFFPRDLDMESMRAGAAYLLGQHDFSAFKAQGTTVMTAVRTIYNINIERSGEMIRLTFTGNGFLQHMVRIMVGTLIQAGLNKYPPDHVKSILLSGERARAGPTAPPCGLCLMSVRYGNDSLVRKFS